MTSPKLTRRSLLRDGSLVGAGLWAAGSLPWPNTVRAAAASDAPAVLTPAEWATLEALTARILPTDHEPGAREAGCTNFIDKALANEEAAALPLYRAGLPALDAAAKARFERAFTALAAAKQDALLGEVAAGTAAGWPPGAPASPMFFETVRVHTLIGFLAHPRYGGNRDHAGWRVTHYPGPRHHRGGYTPEEMAGTAKVKTAWGSEQQ